ncbi:MAG: hypothetical protein M3256_26215 [Actinomycetota bacterium]|nr:hypothetical protein [Actinomycetota bacterium]
MSVQRSQPTIRCQTRPAQQDRFPAGERYALDPAAVNSLRMNLTKQLDVGNYRVQACYGTAASSPSHTWLGSKSRHAAIDIGDAFKEDAEHSLDFPNLLRWPSAKTAKANFTTYIRAQRVK